MTIRQTLDIFFDPIGIDHDTGPGHPESPKRLRAIESYLTKYFSDIPLQSANPASTDALKRIHDKDYVDGLFALRGQHARLDPDTIISPKSIDVATIAAGLAIKAVESTIRHQRPAFALIRPPGHHAEAGRAMGFCLFNNIAIATAHAIAELDVHRVLIVDWDVHHGNGTQNAFYDRRDVLYFSTHQSPLYPGTGKVDETGRDHGAGYTINVPMPAGTGDAGLLEAFHTILVPAARDFAPDLVVVSAGFDAHRLDPLAGMEVTTAGFAKLTEIVRHIADECADGRLAFILEGGYDVAALVGSVGRCITSLQTAITPLPTFDESPLEHISSSLRNARRRHSKYWEITPF